MYRRYIMAQKPWISIEVKSTFNIVDGHAYETKKKSYVTERKFRVQEQGKHCECSLVKWNWTVISFHLVKFYSIKYNYFPFKFWWRWGC